MTSPRPPNPLVLSIYWAFLVDNISYTFSQLVAGGIQLIPCGSIRREDSWELASGFLRTLPYTPFTFDFTLYHSCDYDHILSPVISSKSLNMKVVLGTPNTEDEEKKAFLKS